MAKKKKNRAKQETLCTSLQYYQDEQKQERRQDECSEGVGNHRGRLLLWFPKQVLQR